MVQSMTQLLLTPIEVFSQEIQEHFASSGWRLVHRLEMWLELHEAAERGPAAQPHTRSQPSRDRPPSGQPLDEQLPLGMGSVAHSSPTKPGEEGGPGGAGTSIMEEELEDSGLSPSTIAPSQQELSQSSDMDSGLANMSLGAESGVGSGTVTDSVLRAGAVESSSATVVGGVVGTGSQPAVRPKKRRKSYRSFLPERSGYPDIGFPLFPLSKGFVKSVRGVLLQYRATLAAAGIPEHTEDN